MKLPGKVKVFEQVWYGKRRYGIRFYWPFKAVITDIQEIPNPFGKNKLYRKVPLLFDTEEEAQRFIEEQLLEHWQKLQAVEIVEGL